jgi:hypothetical protein
MELKRTGGTPTAPKARSIWSTIFPISMSSIYGLNRREFRPRFGAASARRTRCRDRGGWPCPCPTIVSCRAVRRYGQRTALARCLARKPEVLLLDEPFGALDEVTRSEMQDLLLKIVANFRTATLLVTHDIDEALLLADCVLLLGGAPARQIGVWQVTLPKPRQDYVAELGALRIDILQILRHAVRRH